MSWKRLFSTRHDAAGPFRLSRDFTVASLVGFTLALTLLVWIHRETSIESLKQQEIRTHTSLTTAFANTLWAPYAEFVRTAASLPRAELLERPEIESLRSVVAQQTRDTAIVKISIYDASGYTVFSTETAEIGEDRRDAAGVVAARRGEIASAISFRDQFNTLVGVIADRNIISTQVPIRARPGGPVAGILELHSDVTPLIREISATGRRVALSVGGLLALLYVFLLFIVRRADHQLALHEAARADSDARMRYQAYHDLVTGLPNRASFNEQLEAALRRTKRAGRSTAVLLLDLDGFKLVNDSLGHDAGDELLKGVADRIEFCTRESDMVFRVGGDEFTVIAERLDTPESAANLAQRILNALAQPTRLGERDVVVGASIGIAVYPRDENNAEMLVKGADAAMYRAKEGGRNRFEFYTPDMNAEALARLSLQTDLKRALEHEEFVLHYQPRGSLNSGKIVGVEALLRWNRGRQELLAPDRFLTHLESSGLIIPVGEWVLREACRQNRAWQDQGLPPMRVSVNISSPQFRSGSLASVVRAALRESRLDARLLELELTESLLVEDTEEAIKILAELKAIGVSIAIDDFGSGYSSLNYLKRFPVDFLKIDRSFIRDIATNAKDAAITTNIVALARSLGLQTVAEGVEDREQLDVLGAQGCDEVQGFLFSRPVAAETMATAVASAGTALAPALPRRRLASSA
jgi:diguanylate cyclase (GGDEF)-like protein